MNAQATVIGTEERVSRSFVVNLCASTTPVALAPPEDPEFASYQFFVTRRTEEGRDRFRLHMGYFASLADAREMVEDLRKRYPTAWAGPAPTGIAPETVATVMPSADALDALSNVRQVLATLDMDSPERTLLTPAQQWSLLESGKLPDPHYAVQLLWSERPVDPATLPQPALFDVYTLYHVEGQRNGLRCYGLRLGFFTDVDAAKRVACYLKPDYDSVAVVPVTEAERDSANGEGQPRLLRRAAPELPPVPESTLPSIAPFEPESPVEARLDLELDEAPTGFQADSPFRPEAVLLAVPNGITLDGGLAAPEPFVLSTREFTAQAPIPNGPRSPLDVKMVDVAPIDAPVAAARPDTRTLDLLGASALSVVEENPARGLSTLPKPPAMQPEPKSDDLSASAIRHMKGLAKLFTRRGA